MQHQSKYAAKSSLINKDFSPEGSATDTDGQDITAHNFHGTDSANAYGIKIGKKEITHARGILDTYKSRKADLDRRIIDNNRWWELKNTPADSGKTYSSPWLFNMLANKHADAMDNFPEPTVLPRESSDTAVAKVLSEVLPAVLDRVDFVDTYSTLWWQKLKSPAGVYGVFWDKEAGDGIGDISVKSVDLLNLFWAPDVKDIQSSPHFFHVTKTDTAALQVMYPHLRDDLAGESFSLGEYSPDTSGTSRDKSIVIDWYYKKKERVEVSEGISTYVTRLHYCKFCNDTVLYASENDPAYSVTGYYTHGMYPYFFDPVFPSAHSPVGLCFVDVAKGIQEQIDLLDGLIMKNAVASCRKRLIYNENAGINVEDLLDYTKDAIPSTLSAASFRDAFYEIENQPISGIYLSILQGKIQELKETTGNRDVSQGGSSGGVTAASGIAAQQEAAGKLSRDMIMSSYRVFTKVCYMCIELMRQFYDIPRTFRIIGEGGLVRFMDFSGADLMSADSGIGLFDDTLDRVPVFDIKVKTHKANPYGRAAQEERFLAMFRSGFFDPRLADQALLCLTGMDFEGKDAIYEKIASNAAAYAHSTQGADPEGYAPAPLPTRRGTPAFGSSFVRSSEPAIVTKARMRAAQATSPG